MTVRDGQRESHTGVIDALLSPIRNPDRILLAVFETRYITQIREISLILQCEQYRMSISLPTDWDNRREDVYERDDYTCANCKANGNKPNIQLHAHHIVPRKQGGSHRLSNLKTLCSQCHLAVHHNFQAPTEREPISYDEYITKQGKDPEEWTEDDKVVFDKTWEMASKKAEDGELPDKYLPDISSCKKSFPVVSLLTSNQWDPSEYEPKRKTNQERWDEQRHELYTEMS